MNQLNNITPTQSSPKKEMLKTVESQIGFLPNVFLVLSESTPALGGLIQLNNLFAHSSLNDKEQHIVQLAASVENQCSYCVAGHSMFISTLDGGAEIAAQVTQDAALTDSKYNELNRFVRELVRERGKVSKSSVERFFAAGYNSRNILDVVLGVAIKTITNFTNNIANTDLDTPFKAFSWEPQA